MQLVAYGIVIGFGTIGPAMAAQSLSPLRIAQSQTGVLPNAVMLPVSLALYIVAGLAQTFRPPFTKPIEGAFDALATANTNNGFNDRIIDSHGTCGESASVAARKHAVSTH